MKRFQFIALLFAPLIRRWRPRRIKNIAGQVRETEESKNLGSKFWASYEVAGYKVYYDDGTEQLFSDLDSFFATDCWKEHVRREMELHPEVKLL